MDSSTRLHQIIAFRLKQKAGPGLEFAWILDEKGLGPHQPGRIYWAGMPRESQAPSSAVIKLIQGLFDRFQDQSFFLLRQRIFSTTELTPMDLGMIRLTAKRATGGIHFPANVAGTSELHFDSEWIEMGETHTPIFQSSLPQVALPPGPASFAKSVELRAYLEFLQGQIPRGSVLHDHNRPVAAVLLDSRNRLLAQSVHGGFLNKTLHAEVRLCQDYFRQTQASFPEAACMVVTLKPCKMCAAMIVKMAEHRKDLRVIYLEDDPGTLARETALDGDPRFIAGTESVPSLFQS